MYIIFLILDNLGVTCYHGLRSMNLPTRLQCHMSRDSDKAASLCPRLPDRPSLDQGSKCTHDEQVEALHDHEQGGDGGFAAMPGTRLRSITCQPWPTSDPVLLCRQTWPPEPGYRPRPHSLGGGQHGRFLVPHYN